MEYLSASYGGTLAKGENFFIRFLNEKERNKKTEPYKNMGRIFNRDGNFFSDECKKFTGLEIFPLPLRFFLNFLFKTVSKNMFIKAAAKWGCTKPLDHKPYQEDCISA